MNAPSPTRVPEFLSAKFRFWSFISMVLLVFVHGYTIEPRYLQAWTQPDAALSFTSFTEYLFSNGLLRFRIPMLFVISGFLFALHDSQPYGQRIQKRVRTLVLPYLLWSALHIVILYLMETDATMRGWVGGSGIAFTPPNNALLHDAEPGMLAVRWLMWPLPYQLWFIRVLFLLNLLYPLLLMAVNKPLPAKIFFALAFLAWLHYLGLPFIEGEGLLFFALGIWMQKTGFNIETPKRWLKPAPWAVVMLVSALAKTWLAFEGQRLNIGEAVFPIMGYLHKITVASGLIAAWFGCDPLVRFFMARPWFVWLSAFSFMIYALHAPLVAVLIDPTIRLFADWPEPQLMTYLFLPLALIATAVLLGAALRRFAPPVYGLLTGGRGL